MFDVVIAGAGVVGASAALRLAADGMRVLLLDASPVPGRGSRAAAGIAVPSVRLLDDPVMVAFARRGQEVMHRDLDRLGVARCAPGVLRPVPDERAAERLARLAEPYPGFLGEWVGPDVLAEDGWRGQAHGGFLDPGAMVIDAAGYVDALVAAARDTGAEVRLGVGLREVSGTGVATDDGRVAADRVVVAMGAWTGTLPFGPPVRPLRGQLVRVRPPQRPRRVVSGPLYTAPAPDGETVLVGATEENVGFAEGPTADGVRALLTEIARAWPGLRSAPFTTAWSGFRAATDSGRPFIGEVPGMSRVIVASGHCGQGILTGGHTADLVRDLILGRQADVEPFAVATKDAA